uniref:Uncharacterized protein n=1 Tax=Romanomermis culicivorax TaxID=13658 RepID=A0A915IC64_ROMCU
MEKIESLDVRRDDVATTLAAVATAIPRGDRDSTRRRATELGDFWTRCYLEKMNFGEQELKWLLDHKC